MRPDVDMPPQISAAGAPHRLLRCIAALGAAFAALMLGVMVTTWLQNWDLPLDPIPWGFILVFGLMLGLLWSGISLLRAPTDGAELAFMATALPGVPLALFWALIVFGD